MVRTVVMSVLAHALAFASLAQGSDFSESSEFSCVYSLEKVSNGSKHLLDYIEAGYKPQIRHLVGKSGDLAKLKENAYFKGQTFAVQLADAINIIRLSLPEFADHLTNLLLNSTIKNVKEIPSRICGESMQNQIVSPVDVFRTYVAIPVAVHESAFSTYPNGTRTFHVDERRLSTLSDRDKAGVFVNLALTAYLFHVDHYGTPYLAGDKYRVRTVHVDLLSGRYTPEILRQRINNMFTTKTNQIVFWESGSLLSSNPFIWVNPNLGQTCYNQDSGFKDLVPNEISNNHPNPWCWLTFNSYEMQTIKARRVYKTPQELREIDLKCHRIEAEYEVVFQTIFPILGQINQAVYEWVGFDKSQVNCSLPSGLKREVVATNFWTRGEAEICGSYDWQSRLSRVEDSLMNPSYGQYGEIFESWGGGEYFSKTKIIDNDRNLTKNFDWTQLISWSEFRAAAQTNRRLYLELMQNEFRCNVDLNKAHYLRNLQVNGVE